ncbi:hypothetical protein [Thalassospira aquimaris]|uniref:Lipoprotein n=1 Tax=Thalassospira aquimaris TaxID=3037796 RepID=A0ABT6GBB3_9PROT|nr:hypothetical protein [Thalassospira sp. FZY0004]MDG4719338.1 hypothetical protein [Thalassospira sp. FZY0004]
MKRNTACLNVMFSLGAFLVSGCSAVSNHVDIAAYRMIPLVTDPGGEKHCSQDQKWCVQLDPNADSGVMVSVTQDDKQARERTLGSGMLADADADAFGATDHDIWPFLIMGDDASGNVLVGITSTISTGYSGGGAEAHFLDLIGLEAGGIPSGATSPVVLSVPLGAMKMIRACFDEDDIQKRRDVCHDEYRFEADIRLENHGTAGLPDVLYTSTATAFPATVSLDQDSTQLPALRDEDLVERVDERCSFERVFRFDVTSGRYQPDAPLPACDDYLIP